MQAVHVIAAEAAAVVISDRGPVFRAALVVHILAGLTSVVSGALAAASRKQGGRHPAAGTVYFWGLGAVFATATVMASMRWSRDAHLFAIAAIAYTLAIGGRIARRRRPQNWAVWHAAGMGGSYIALLTGFYVDNGSQLPVWDRLPHLAYWVLPAAVGVPLIVLGLVRFGAPRLKPPRPGARRTGAPPAPQE
ncbi:hypothetical protein ACTMTJ_35100 [Phytohabitans sp. LJ34]|uniref:hypothetical protein n=1 Tax=Phytohabitans sp. LJ34 TaxID=3452217 RepID=UPI003F8AB500